MEISNIYGKSIGIFFRSMKLASLRQKICLNSTRRPPKRPARSAFVLLMRMRTGIIHFRFSCEKTAKFTGVNELVLMNAHKY